MKVHIIENHGAKAYLSKLRDKNTSGTEFRRLSKILGIIIGTEIANLLDYQETPIETPFEKTKGTALDTLENVVAITTVEDGFPITEGIKLIFPEIREGLAGVRRVANPGSKKDGIQEFLPEIAFMNVPMITSKDAVIIVKFCLATGCTISAILQQLQKQLQAPPKAYFVCAMICAEKGIEELESIVPDSTVVTFAIDSLDENGYLRPGIGNVPKRMYAGVH